MRTTRPSRLPRAAFAIVTLGLLGAGLAAPSQAATPRSATTPVTWNGWRGAALDSTLVSAQSRLGGRLQKSATDGGCGDVLVTRNGRLDGNSYARPHRVGNISVTARVQYPLGLRKSMTPARAERLVRQSDHRLHRYVDRSMPTPSYEDWVVGPHGHTLYFLHIDGKIYRMGLAVNSRVAKRQMEMNGC